MMLESKWVLVVLLPLLPAVAGQLDGRQEEAFGVFQSKETEDALKEVEKSLKETLERMKERLDSDLQAMEKDIFAGMLVEGQDFVKKVYKHDMT